MKKPDLNPPQKEFIALMKSVGWSAAETSRQLECSRSAISQIVSGKNTPTSLLDRLRQKIVQTKGYATEKQTVPNEASTLAERMLWLSKRLVLSPEQLAGYIGREKAFGVDLVSGKISKLSDTSAQLLCDALRMNRNWIEKGVGEPFIVPIRQLVEPGGIGSGLRTFSFKKVPVISWSRAGKSGDFDEIPTDWQEHQATDCPDPKCFGLYISGDSMEPEHREGSIAFVMPSSLPSDGDLVIARLRQNGVLFKQFHLVGSSTDKFVLTSLNPKYPPIQCEAEDFEWVYPVYAVTKVYKRN